VGEPTLCVEAVPGSCGRVKRAFFSLAANIAPQEVVAAVAGKVLRVTFVDLSVPAGATAVWYSAAAAISHAMSESRVWPSCRDGWCVTVAGEALNLLATGGTIKGLVGYIEE
jgi:hypothetical protein